MTSSLTLVLVSCAVLGFRHGFDYDHIAAITDIAGMQARPADTMRRGLLYALGHALTVAALGTLVIALHLRLPVGMDRWAERIVGLTLILLAVYVLSTLLRSRGQGRPKSRAMLLIDGAHWLRASIRRTPPSSNAAATRDINDPACFGIGIIHGLGAETPSQLALFLLAANLGGTTRGLLGLGVFLLGLVTMNTLMTASAAGLFRVGRFQTRLYPVLTGLTAVYSFGIGIIFLLGYSDHLANITG